MGDKIIGINAVHEISRTRKAMNRHCTKVMLKSKDAGGVTNETPTEEDSIMEANIMKSFAGLQARVGATGMSYVAQLAEEKVKSFFEQTAEAQDAEVTAWDESEKAKAAAAQAEKAKSEAGDPEIVALRAEVETLKSAASVEKAKSRDLELKDIAKSQYGAVPKALEVLKSIEGLTDEQRKPTLDVLKAQQEMAKSMGITLGDDTSGEGTATARYDTLVETVAKEKNITKSAAILEIAQDPQHAALVDEHRAELAG